MRKFVFAAIAALLCCVPAMASQQHPAAWNFYQVDSPSGATILTGINNLSKVVGYVRNAGVDEAVTAEAPYAAWSNINYPGASASLAMGLSNTRIQVGFYKTTSGTIGYIRNAGAYFSAQLAGSAYLGTNHIQCYDPDVWECHGDHVPNPDILIVGYSGTPARAFEFDATADTIEQFSPPGAVSSMAIGINGHGSVVGLLVTSSGTTQGWIVRDGIYHVLSYPGARYTAARGINWQDDVVGDYQDASGKTHGFIASQPTSKAPVWQSIDYPGASKTVIRSINDHDDFVGDYVGADGAHGFLAQPAPTASP